MFFFVLTPEEGDRVLLHPSEDDHLLHYLEYDRLLHSVSRTVIFCIPQMTVIYFDLQRIIESMTTFSFRDMIIDLHCQRHRGSHFFFHHAAALAFVDFSRATVQSRANRSSCV
eukprot:TRINITY_DN572_c0_g1_i3.p2 TRINITY_DN572_c0_g1~~TRINITY_DN572_c0_g1_i3.p2  ORF type:complete len:113 (+),score=20.74 TRINITY_DN572_c0_g1_i3:1238-1576(+)